MCSRISTCNTSMLSLSFLPTDCGVASCTGMGRDPSSPAQSVAPAAPQDQLQPLPQPLPRAHVSRSRLPFSRFAVTASSTFLPLSALIKTINDCCLSSLMTARSTPVWLPLAYMCAKACSGVAGPILPIEKETGMDSLNPRTVVGPPNPTIRVAVGRPIRRVGTSLTLKGDRDTNNVPS